MNITDQLAQALEDVLRANENNTGHEPSCSVMDRACDEAEVILATYRASKEGEKVELTYWAIIGGYTGHVIGVCTEKSDVLAEEPLATFVQITEEQFEAYRSDSDTLDHLSRRPIRAT